MEFRKSFSFNKRFTELITENYYVPVSFNVRVAGSFVIYGPDWPPEMGFPPPEKDEKLVDEVFATLEEVKFGYEEGNEIRSIYDIPRHTKLLEDILNGEERPFRWEFETGYKVRQFNLTVFAPADDISAEKIRICDVVTDTTAKMLAMNEIKKSLAPGLYHIDENNNIVFYYDRIHNQQFWDTGKQFNVQFDLRADNLHKLQRVELKELDMMNRRMVELIRQQPDEQTRNYLRQMEQALEYGMQPDKMQMDRYRQAKYLVEELPKEMEKLNTERDKLIDEYKKLCEFLKEKPEIM